MDTSVYRPSDIFLKKNVFFSPPVALQPNVGRGLLILEIT